MISIVTSSLGLDKFEAQMYVEVRVALAEFRRENVPNVSSFLGCLFLKLTSFDSYVAKGNQ